MAAPAKKPWTVLIYMAGDNNLDPNGVTDLKEMKSVGSTATLNVVAQFDRRSGHAAKRYLLRKGGSVTKDAVATAGKVNTGDPKRLIDFITWGIKQYPADRYALILWNHGQGWDDTDIYADERLRRARRLGGRVRHALFHPAVKTVLKRAARDPQARAILLDDDAKDFLDNREMKNVLAATRRLLTRKLDVFGMDACLMSMVEVAYQVRDSVDYIVGSEQTEPLDGWPYGTILAGLRASPATSPRDLAVSIVGKYVASYTRDAVTQSAGDLSKIGPLATAIKGLAVALRADLKDDATRQQIIAARARVQCYDVADNIDLVDFCTLLGAAAPHAASAARARNVITAAGGFLVAQGHKGAAVKNSHGVAIYFPTQAISPLYAGLDFTKATGWGEFLAAYLNAVRMR